MSKETINEKEFDALIRLLDDEDSEVLTHVEKKLMSLGPDVIPSLEKKWETSFNPIIQKRLEDLIHRLQFDLVKMRLDQWVKSDDKDLLEGLWAVATYSYPELELSTLRKDVEQLYYEVWLQFREDGHPYDMIKMINSVLFSKLHFGPNSKNFHSPGNSMINVVLESRKGNPITLCCVYLLVAQRLNLPIYGVNLPNLFVLVFQKGDIKFYINAFNRGLIFTKLEIDQYIQQLHLQPLPEFYDPCDHLTIIRRVLRNLENAYEKLGEQNKLTEVLELREVVGDSSII